MLRILLPFPCAALLTSLYVWGCFKLFSALRFEGWGWVVLGSVILGIAIFVLGWRSPRWFLRAFPVPCPSCGQIARLHSAKNDTARYLCDHCSTGFNSHWNAGQLIGGLFVAGMGVTCITIAIFTFPEIQMKGLAFLNLCGIFLIAIGVGLIGQRPLWNWLVKKMPWMEHVPWNEILGGGIATGIGVMFICIGILSEDESNMPSGRGAVIVAGSVFALAGLCILLPVIGNYVKILPQHVIRRLGTFFAICLLICFAAVPALIAWHDAGTPAAHPVPYIATGVIVSLLGVVIYVYFRDRKKKDV